MRYFCKIIIICQLIVHCSLETSALSHDHSIRRHRSKSPHHQHFKFAASNVRKISNHDYEYFSLNCPHVVDSHNKEVEIEATWTLNNTIWLKIHNGEERIFNRLTSFTGRKLKAKNILRVFLNDGRYMFDYNELTGHFSMEIRPVQVEEDVGVWQCHLTVSSPDHTHTLTSRSRVKAHVSEQPETALIGKHRMVATNQHSVVAQSQIGNHDEIRSFFRPDEETVLVNRPQLKPSVVFSRSDGLIEGHADEFPSDDSSVYGHLRSRSRTRSTLLSNRYHKFTYHVLLIVLILAEFGV